MSRGRYVTGLRAVEQLLDDRSPDVLRVHTEHRSANSRVQAVIATAKKLNIDVQFANRARLTQMSGDERHQGVVAEVRRATALDEAGLRDLVERRLQDDGAPLLLLLLDGVQDPHNLGACLRTADAAGVDAVIVPRRGAAQLGPTVSKVAAGAAERLPFASVTQIPRVLDWLGDYGVTRVGTADGASEGLYEVDVSGDMALVMGAEHAGLTRRVTERCDRLISIPMHGAVSSLNVSVATGVCLYEFKRRLGKPPTGG